MAIERLTMGLETRLGGTPVSWRRRPIMKSAHLLVVYTASTHDVLRRRSRVAEGLGGDIPVPEDFHATASYLFAAIKASLAIGYVAEKIEYGYTTDGVAADLTTPCELLTSQMVWVTGWGTNSLWATTASYWGRWRPLRGPVSGRHQNRLNPGGADHPPRCDVGGGLLRKEKG